MNKQGNTYTFLYSVVMVVVVAAVLSMISLSLLPLQEKNRMNEKRQNILSAINITSTAETAEDMLSKYVKEEYVVNAKGEKQNISGTVLDIDIAAEYSKKPEDRKLPVYEATVDGAKKYILPIYGAGLWGPIWGYISLNDDKETVYGLYLGHQGETPGLGAEIATDKFRGQFPGKKISSATGLGIAIVKGATNDQVEAISGGTITSKGVEAMLKAYLTNYESFLK